MKKILSVVLLAASLQAAVPTQQAEAGLILAAAIGGDAGNSVGSAFIGTGLVSMVVGYAVGCDRSETTYHREPVYVIDRYGRRIRTGWRRVETTRCVVWNGNSTASTLLWAGLGAIILDNEVNATGDALDSSLQENLPFVESKEVRANLANTILKKAAPVFAAGHDTAIISLTADETREALSDAILTDAEMETAINLMK